MLETDTYIISFDPGRTTGLVVSYYYSGRSFDIVRAEEIKWIHRFQDVRDIIWLYRKDTCAIIIEDFKLRKDLAESQAGDDMPSSQMIGIIECRAFDLGILNKVYKQMPSAKSRINILDRHHSTVACSEHIKDAYQHTRYFIISQLAKGGKL